MSYGIWYIITKLFGEGIGQWEAEKHIVTDSNEREEVNKMIEALDNKIMSFEYEEHDAAKFFRDTVSFRTRLSCLLSKYKS
jgi:hypothetical protein